jgi:glyoxylase I family protein
MSSALTALKLDHVAIPIFRVAESRAFYGETLGLSLLSAHTGDDWGGYPWLMMIFGLGDERQLALVALRGARPESTLPEDAQHIAFTVGSETELGAWRDKLRHAQIAFTEEDHGTQRSLYFKDPNGITLELTTPTAAPAPDRSAEQVIARFLATQ